MGGRLSAGKVFPGPAGATPLLLGTFVLAGAPPAQHPIAVSVRSVLEEQVSEGRAAGSVAVVEVDGQVVLEHATGARIRGAKAPMVKDAVFLVDGMARPVTTVAALILMEEGRIALEAPVADYLPELADARVAVHGDDAVSAERAVTVLDLMRHTSGYRTPLIRQMKSITLERLVQGLGKMPIQFEPGTRWDYGISTDVLGRVVEVVSGEALADFSWNRVFKPLQMLNSGYRLRKKQMRRLCAMYWRSETGRLIRKKTKADPTELPAYVGGAGGLYSTAGDYHRFARMLLAGGILDGQRILQPETVRLMTVDHLGTVPRTELLGRTGFGLGVGVVPEPVAEVIGCEPGSFFWGGVAGCSFWVDPKRRLIGIYMTQTLHAPELRREFQAALYRD